MPILSSKEPEREIEQPDSPVLYHDQILFTGQVPASAVASELIRLQHEVAERTGRMVSFVVKIAEDGNVTFTAKSVHVKREWLDG